MIVQPLFGHTSPETAYVVEDYPYSFKLRTTIRYWLEHKPSKGYRFVSQTINPKTGRWNAPKESTYTEFAAAMYLDENGHVHWTGLGVYSKDSDFYEFALNFRHMPRDMADTLIAWLRKKVRVARDFISGRIYITINDVRREQSEADVARHQAEISTFIAALDLLVVSAEDEALIAELRANGLHAEADDLLHELRGV